MMILVELKRKDSMSVWECRECGAIHPAATLAMFHEHEAHGRQFEEMTFNKNVIRERRTERCDCTMF